MTNHNTRRKKLLVASPVSALAADKAYTLLELAEHLQPRKRTLYYWRKTIEWLANNHRWPTWLDVMEKPLDGASRSARRWSRPSWRESLDELKQWGKKSERYDQVLRRSEVLHTRLLTVIRDVIASSDYLTQGVRPDGISAEVSRDIAHQLHIDLENSTLSTSRGMTWQEVTVRGGSKRRLPTVDEVTGWYLERVAKHDPSHPPPSREEDVKAGKVFFRKAGFRTGEALKELVRNVRTNEAPSDWTISGPKGRKIHAQAQRSNLARD
jgi:hypothetical protein